MAETFQVSQDITLNEKNHTALLKHVIDRMEFVNEFQTDQIERFRGIDREMSGNVRLSREDKKRERDNRMGYAPKPTDANPEFVDTQVDEMVTYLLSLYAPDEGMYSAIASEEKQSVAKGLATLMNKHAKEYGHYENLERVCTNGCRYNFGPFTVEWRNKQEALIRNAAATANPVIDPAKDELSGNELRSLDPYNTYYDISVPPTRLYDRGEWFAEVELNTEFRVKRMDQSGQIFNADIALGTNTYEIKYYKSAPQIRDEFGNRGPTNWDDVFSFGDSGLSGPNVRRRIEFINFVGWIIPAEFGIKTNDQDNERFQLYRITVLAGWRIVSLQKMPNAHGMLPIFCLMPVVNKLGVQANSFAERLIPMARFASSQMNTHIQANRKSLYGMTFYNPVTIPLGDKTGDELLASTIPIKPTMNQDFDIRKHLAQFTDAPDTQNTMQDVADVLELMNKLLPTDIIRQIANLERATQYQAAATVQAGNRRSTKVARLGEDQAMHASRKAQLKNIMQFQESVTILSDDGTEVEINPKEFREQHLEMVISDGLKGIDRLIIVESLRDVINMMLQSTLAQEGKVDIIAVINYWLSLMGDNLDFNQFKVKDPFDQLPREQKQMAMQLLQEAVNEQQNTQGALPAPTNGQGIANA